MESLTRWALLEDQRGVNRQLLCSGAEMHQINTAREHFLGSREAAWPAHTITRAISDVHWWSTVCHREWSNGCGSDYMAGCNQYP